jgi:acetyl esterase/lipase
MLKGNHMFRRAMTIVLAANLAVLAAAAAPAAAAEQPILFGIVRAAPAGAEEAATVKAGSTVYKIVKDANGRKVADQAKDRPVEIKGNVVERNGAKWIAVTSCKIIEFVPPSPRGANAGLPQGAKAMQNVQYAQVGDKSLLLDLYLPAQAKGPLPLVVWIHGGAWSAGSKEGCPAVWLVGRGYAVASINYRLSQEAIFPAQIEDCKAAIRYLRASAARYSIDANHIGVWGSSAGGHLVALLGTSGDVKELEGAVGDNLTASSRVQCVVDYFGPTDFMKFKDQPTWVKVNQPDSPLVRLVGGLLEEKKDLVAKANPITFISRDDPPFLVAHGDKDNTVPISQSQLLVAALRKAGVAVTFEVVKGAGHGFNGVQNEALNSIVTSFFDKHLKGAAAPTRAPAK